MVSPQVFPPSIAAVLLLAPLMTAVAQEGKSKQIILPRGGYLQLKMETEKPIGDVRTDKGEVVQIINTASQKIIGLRGIAAGSVRLTLTDTGGTKETYEILVREQVLVPVGISVLWKWPEDKAIKTLVIENDKLARLRMTAGDDRTVNIEPLEPGNTRFSLTDAEGKAHIIELSVRKPDRLIGVGEVIELQVTSKKAIRWVNIQEGSIIAARLAGLDAKVMSPKDSRDVEIILIGKEVTVLPIVGSSVGLTRVSLKDNGGKEETLYIGVQPKK